MPNRQHLLIAGLGKSPDAILEIADWFYNWREWSNQPPENLKNLSEIWVLTTEGLDQKSIICYLQERLKEVCAQAKLILRKVKGVRDIENTGDHIRMSEVLCRTMLQAEIWKKRVRDKGDEAILSLCLSGGRKTMSAVFQEMADFFSVDALVHVVSSLENEENHHYTPSEDRPKVSPFCLAENPSPWAEICYRLWDYRFPAAPLTPNEFGFSAGNFETPEEQLLITTSRTCEPKFLYNAIKEVAGESSKKFLELGLNCGTSASFLRHDLKRLLENMLKNSRYKDSEEILVLKEYCIALGLINKEDKAQMQISVENLLKLIPKAALLATGNTIPANGTNHWLKPGEFEITIVTQGCENIIARGLSENNWLIVLRNLLANVFMHAQRESDDRCHAMLTFSKDREGQNLIVEMKNKVSWATHQELYAIDKAQNLQSLFNPLVKSNESSGDGLGLYTIALLAREGEGVSLEPLTIQKETSGDFFVVKLKLPIEH